MKIAQFLGGIILGVIVGAALGMNFTANVRDKLGGAVRGLGSGSGDSLVLVAACEIAPGTIVSPDVVVTKSVSNLLLGLVTEMEMNVVTGKTTSVAVPAGAPLLWQFFNLKRHDQQ